MNFLSKAILLFTFIAAVNAQTLPTGNVIFIHPDGTGLSDWNATRILYYGPDGELNWDRMTNLGIYKSHMLNSISASSHAGATIHAYGVKVLQDSFGMNGKEEVAAYSGKALSIMEEAHAAGIKCGLVNSGSIIEPGTSVFVASSPSRSESESITKQVVMSGVEVILSGGEEWMLPEGEIGFHKGEGKRTDGTNLIEWAKDKGYVVVYNKEQLMTISPKTQKVLGVFANGHTFNDKSEEVLEEEKLPNFKESAPTLAEMTEKAIQILSKNQTKFFLVVEEEATDNFANANNANGTLEALKRADDAVGVSLNFIKENPNTLLITAADSDAGGLELLGDSGLDPEKNLSNNEKNGSPIDGKDGTGSLPFLSAPDMYGKRLPFYVAWSTFGDAHGSVIAKTSGLNANLMKNTIDNTEIYKIMFATLFGVYLK
ncbi:MAG: alkaline phosphatase [Bacteroidetes bacterium]|nr:alkaline phosphatase [Bacteroidota bacterium]